MRVMFIGDIFGSLGRKAVNENLHDLIRQYKVNVVIANGENSAHGRGITEKIYKELMSYGVNVITLGNHSFDNQDVFNFIDEKNNIIRPANYGEEVPGNGVTYFRYNNLKMAVINVMGRVYLPATNCPFKTMDEILKEVKKVTDIAFVDVHAEATSEKISLGYYLDGRVSAVVGTHTHVPTNDARVLPKGTAYITDVGMTGPLDGVIGMNRDNVIKKFITGLPLRFEPVDKGPKQFNAVVVDIDEKTGKAAGIETINIIS